MEQWVSKWKNFILKNKIPQNPTFQYSNWGEAPKFIIVKFSICHWDYKPAAPPRKNLSFSSPSHLWWNLRPLCLSLACRAMPPFSSSLKLLVALRPPIFFLFP
jgi:hypothetical protein